MWINLTQIFFITIKQHAQSLCVNEAISVERPSTVWSSTEAGDLVIFDGELVIVGDLLSHCYVSLRVDHNLLQGTKIDHLGIAIGL